MVIQINTVRQLTSSTNYNVKYISSEYSNKQGIKTMKQNHKYNIN